MYSSHIRNGPPVFPYHVLRSGRTAKLHLCIQVFHTRCFCFGNLLKVHEALENLHEGRMPGQKRIRGGIDAGSMDTYTAVIDVPLWERDGER